MTSPPTTPGRWLESAKAVPTLNRGPLLEPLPQLVVVHYTAGRSAANTIKRFRDPASQVSAHFVVAEDGQVTQMVDCRRKAWHAGASSIALPDGTTLRSLNGCSIGFELDYDGWLTTLSGGRRARTEDDALYAKGRWWPKYDQRQIDALVSTIDELRVRDWLASPCYLTGHEHIAPGRKLDPGPAFPWSEVCERTQLTRLPPLG